MNTAEKIAGTYLRLNGFFLLPQFTVFDGTRHNHIDLVALRAANSEERVDDVVLPVDDQLFETVSIFIDNPKSNHFGAIVEVRTNENRDIPTNEHFVYTSRFLGGLPSVRLSFYEFDDNNPVPSENSINIGNRYAIGWILDRINWMQGQHMRLAKEGSWHLSEEWLADILVLNRLGVIENPQ